VRVSALTSGIWVSVCCSCWHMSGTIFWGRLCNVLGFFLTYDSIFKIWSRCLLLPPHQHRNMRGLWCSSNGSVTLPVFMQYQQATNHFSLDFHVQASRNAPTCSWRVLCTKRLLWWSFRVMFTNVPPLWSPTPQLLLTRAPFSGRKHGLREIGGTMERECRIILLCIMEYFCNYK
jgi:hypothetical protein